MTLGMTLETFTRLHVVISLIGIASGLMAVFGMMSGVRRDGWTTLFLWTTVLTSVTGFGFPVEHLLPSHKVGIISLVVLAIVFVARSRAHSGSWRWIYVIGSVLALYLNVFVLVVQLFGRSPPWPCWPRPSPSCRSSSRSSRSSPSSCGSRCSR
ncbi:MAG TPA: hypothetical protein VNU02_16185 [Candidatus Dormibacteraeota bacterium]|nr:hypothetical protein [Candidatus Dormibacteraeota bacterium]